MAKEPSETLSSPGYGIPQLESSEQSPPGGYDIPSMATQNNPALQQLLVAALTEGGFGAAGPQAVSGLNRFTMPTSYPSQALSTKGVSGGKGIDAGPPKFAGGIMPPGDVAGMPSGLSTFDRIIYALSPPHIQAAWGKKLELLRKTSGARAANETQQEVDRKLAVYDIKGARQVVSDFFKNARFMPEAMPWVDRWNDQIKKRHGDLGFMKVLRDRYAALLLDENGHYHSQAINSAPEMIATYEHLKEALDPKSAMTPEQRESLAESTGSLPGDVKTSLLEMEPKNAKWHFDITAGGWVGINATTGKILYRQRGEGGPETAPTPTPTPTPAPTAPGAPTTPPAPPATVPPTAPAQPIAPTAPGKTSEHIQQMQTLIRQEARRQGVNPDLMVALARQEAGPNFDPNKVGDNGASIGLFQLQKAAAIEMGLKPEERTDPLKNARAGIGYYKKHLDAFNGDEDKALVRFNGGGDPNFVTNVRRHLPQPQRTTPSGQPLRTSMTDLPTPTGETPGTMLASATEGTEEALPPGSVQTAQYGIKGQVAPPRPAPPTTHYATPEVGSVFQQYGRRRVGYGTPHAWSNFLNSKHPDEAKIIAKAGEYEMTLTTVRDMLHSRGIDIMQALSEGKSPTFQTPDGDIIPLDRLVDMGMEPDNKRFSQVLQTANVIQAEQQGAIAASQAEERAIAEYKAAQRAKAHKTLNAIENYYMLLEAAQNDPKFASQVLNSAAGATLSFQFGGKTFTIRLPAEFRSLLSQIDVTNTPMARLQQAAGQHARNLMADYVGNSEFMQEQTDIFRTGSPDSAKQVLSGFMDTIYIDLGEIDKETFGRAGRKPMVPSEVRPAPSTAPAPPTGTPGTPSGQTPGQPPPAPTGKPSAPPAAPPTPAPKSGLPSSTPPLQHAVPETLPPGTPWRQSFLPPVPQGFKDIAQAGKNLWNRAEQSGQSQPTQPTLTQPSLTPQQAVPETLPQGTALTPPTPLERLSARGVPLPPLPTPPTPTPALTPTPTQPTQPTPTFTTARPPAASAAGAAFDRFMAQQTGQPRLTEPITPAYDPEQVKQMIEMIRQQNLQKMRMQP